MEFITEGTSAVCASTGLKQEWFAESSVKSNTEGNPGNPKQSAFSLAQWFA